MSTIEQLARQSGAVRPGPEALFGVDFCGQLDAPGVCLNEPALVNYADAMESTPDQQRIEAVLDALDLAGRHLLHVGVGNSSLARRLAGKGCMIDGITVSQPEQQAATASGVANYRVGVVSKYANQLPMALGKQYDVIIDNNLASFACCGFHFMLMMTNYRMLLKPGGWILTDEQGMDWAAEDQRFRLTAEQLAGIAARLGMAVARVSPMVLAVVRS